MSLRNLIETYSHNLAMKAESVAPQTSYITNGVGFAWGAMTFNEWAMLITLILGVLTFLVNLYFQFKRSKREKHIEERDDELHERKMQSYRDDAKKKDSHQD